MPKATIAVIEDHLEMRENIEEILELADYKVYTAANGKEGVKLLQEQSVDLVLCDIMMPELDGYGVLKIVSSKEKTKHLPFIFLTAKSEKEDFREGMNLGADDYLTKPFSDLDLLKVIEIRLNKNEERKKQYGQGKQGLNSFLKDAQETLRIEDVLSKEREIHFAHNEIIYKENQYPRNLYLLEKGQVKVSKLNVDGKELIVRIIKEGEYFGYGALIENKPYVDTATAIADCQVVTVTKEEFNKLTLNDQATCKSFFKLIAQDYIQLEQKLIDMAYLSVRKRVANSLLELSAAQANNDELIKVKRELLASMAGTAKETVIRVLSDIETEGFIRKEQGGIKVLNQEGIKHLIG